MSSYLYSCSNERCSFKSRTVHGLETHVRRNHLHYNNTAQLHPTKKKRNLTVRRVSDGGSSSHHFNPNNDNGKQDSGQEKCLDVYASLIPKELNDVPQLNKVSDREQESEGVEMIAKAFLKLSYLCSDKTTNEVLRILRTYAKDFSSFSDLFKNVQVIKDHFKHKEVETIRKNGFRSESVSLSSGIQYRIFLRDPIEVLKEQIRCTPSSELKIKPTISGVYSHPINSNIGTKAFREAEMFIKKNKDVNVKWKDITNDGQQSFIGGLQLFSDKSQVSLSAGALSFYPLHCTLVNYTEDHGRDHIMSGRTILAYLPVDFKEFGRPTDKKGERKPKNRNDTLSVLHESIARATQPLHDNALIGIDVSSKENDQYVCHLLLSSYLADNPEAEDMLSVKRGVQTRSPCYRCLVKKEDMPFSTNCELRTLPKTLKILDEMKDGEECAEEKLKELSMHPIPPVLFNFPMIGVHSSVDIYSIFRFEPMHNFSLGISKLLKECAVALLRDEERETTAMKTSNGQPRTFKNIKNSVLAMLNAFLHDVEMSSAGYGLRVDFSKEGSTGRLSGFFNEQGLIGMIEASEYDSIDMVSPFLGVIIDRCCGNYKAEVTIAFTLYVELVNDIFRRFKRPGWDEEELAELSEKIKYFKSHSYNTFNKYQPSRMGTGKWHSLDHIVDDLRAVGSISYMHVGFFENFHKRFKEGYRLTSKRSRTAMSETLNRQDFFISNETSRSDSKHIPTPRPNPSRIEASRSDSGVLVRSGKKTSLNDLELMASEMHTKKVSSGNIFSPSECARRISSTIKEDGLSSLISLLHEKYESLGIGINVSRHIDIQNPASAYISGYNPPSLENDIVEDVVLVPKSSYRILQHVVSMDNFHGTKKDRRDFVMVEGYKNEGIGIRSDMMPVWFAQVLTFLRICSNDRENSQCEKHRRRSCPECNPSLDKELCFVQFFDIISEEELEIDEIDKNLNCIRLKWQRTDGEHGKYKSSRQFGLLPVDSLRGLVHIVPGDIPSSIISKTELRRVQYDGIGNGEDGWPSSVFYVNRFYRSIGKVLHYEEGETQRM